MSSSPGSHASRPLITTGVNGQPWRASIGPSGTIQPWGDAPSLSWCVAAEDRWHVPAEEPTIRQQRLEGTAVTETRLRVPNGDVVHRVFSVADAGGLTVVEVENESTMPVAVAFDHREVLTERPVPDIPIEGIDLPPGAFVLPLGHRASVRVAIPHAGTGPGTLPGGLPTAAQVARGWLAVTDRASSFVLPDGEPGATLATSITAVRCELALGVIPQATDDAAAYAIALGELVRMGERPDHWIPELVDAVEQLGPDETWFADAGLAAADRVLVVAGERRARRDLAHICERRRVSARPTRVPDGPALIPWLESTLASGGALLPDGLPSAWLGSPIEVYGVPTGPTSAVSFAIRWHGARPAVLWEQTGEPIELTAPVVAPAWSTSDVQGETLWPVPQGAPATSGDGSSFS